MQAQIIKPDLAKEFFTPERCYILEIANDPNDETLSISRARVEPNVTTQWHRLRDTDERYIIVQGKGLMEIKGLEPVEVSNGDVLHIPANTPQRITNVGKVDLVFYCVRTPRFQVECYEDVDNLD